MWLFFLTTVFQGRCKILLKHAHRLFSCGCSSDATTLRIWPPKHSVLLWLDLLGDHLTYILSSGNTWHFRMTVPTPTVTSHLRDPPLTQSPAEPCSRSGSYDLNHDSSRRTKNTSKQLEDDQKVKEKSFQMVHRKILFRGTEVHTSLVWTLCGVGKCLLFH